VDASITDRLRKWIAETNSSSELLMENLSKARALNEMVIKHLQTRARYMGNGDHDAVLAYGKEVLSVGLETVVALRGFEQAIAENIHEDQRIIVVDSDGLVLGLVVDHVHEVLNVPTSLMQPAPLPNWKAALD